MNNPSSAQRLLCGFSLVALAVASSSAHGYAGSPTFQLAGANDAWRAVVAIGIRLPASNEAPTRFSTLFAGSGTLISEHGLILSNEHVVSELAKAMKRPLDDPRLPLVAAFPADDRRLDNGLFSAKLLVSERKSDLAILRLGDALVPPRSPLFYVKIGNILSLKADDPLAIYGYPEDTDGKLDSIMGKLLGVKHDVQVGISAWLQVDATLRPGFSGGAGVSADGLLVGVPTQRVLVFSPFCIGEGEDPMAAECPVIGERNLLRSINYVYPLLEKAKTKMPEYAPVKIQGTIVDAANGQPIPNAVFAVLKPGLRWSTYTGKPEHIAESILTDERGRFVSTKEFSPLMTYAVGWTAPGYASAYDHAFQPSRSPRRFTLRRS